MNNIGNRIKKFRKEKGLTQQQLADKLDKSKSLIQKYESNSTNVPTDILFKIADVLDVKIHHILYERESETYKTYEYEDNLSGFFEKGSDKLDELISNNNMLNFSKENMYELLEALKLDFTYDYDENLIYVNHYKNLDVDTTVVTTVDTFLNLISNIYSLRDNFFNTINRSSMSIDEVNEYIVKRIKED